MKQLNKKKDDEREKNLKAFTSLSLSIQMESTNQNG
jgi:hypothetical protein